MLILKNSDLPKSSESGGALAAALTVVATVGLLSAMTFQLNQSTWRQQLAENDKKRAFYLAESGLAESIAALTLGLGGNIASREEPAEFGEGYVFSETLEDQWGNLNVDAWGISGDARHHLSVVLAKLYMPLAREGFFGSEFVTVGAEVSLQSVAAPGSGGGSDSPPRSDTNSGNAQDPGPFGQVSPGQLNNGSHRGLDEARLVQLDNENRTIDWFGGGDFKLNTWDNPEPTGKKYADGVPFGSGDQRPSPPDDTEAKLGSNGPIQIEPGVTTQTLIDASVHPGPGQVVTPGVGVSILGDTTPRSEPTDLPILEPPTLDPAGDLTLAEGLAQLLEQPASEYGAVSLTGSSVLTIAGPAQVVCTSLSIGPNCELSIDSSLGPVEIHVRERLILAPGAEVISPTLDSTGLLLYVHGQDPVGVAPDSVLLRGTGTFHGLLYAPEANLALPSTMAFVGSVIGRSLVVGPGTSLRFDPALLNESYSALQLEILSWRIADVPIEMRSQNYNPQQRYRDTGTTPARLEDARQVTEQILHYTDADGDDFVYRGNMRITIPPGALIHDDIGKAHLAFEKHMVAPGQIEPLQIQ